MGSGHVLVYTCLNLQTDCIECTVYSVHCILCNKELDLINATPYYSK